MPLSKEPEAWTSNPVLPGPRASLFFTDTLSASVDEPVAAFKFNSQAVAESATLRRTDLVALVPVEAKTPLTVIPLPAPVAISWVLLAPKVKLKNVFDKLVMLAVTALS